MNIRKQPANGKWNSQIERALERLDLLAIGLSETEDYTDQANQLKRTGEEFGKFSDEYVRGFISLTQSLYTAGRMSYDMAYFMISWSVETLIRDTRCLEGVYDTELSPINERLERIRGKYGLSEDEHWPQGEGPPEYQVLINQYDAILDKKLIEAFVEFGMPEIGTEFEAGPEKHNRILENGLHAYFGEEASNIDTLQILIETYEQDAEVSFESGAFYAACALLGAALEGCLLDKCLREPKEASSAISKLVSKDKPASSNPLHWSLSILLRVCDAAGWLPILEGNEVFHQLSGWGHYLNRMRNKLHPGNHLRFLPSRQLEESDYSDLLSIYLLIKNTIST